MTQIAQTAADRLAPQSVTHRAAAWVLQSLASQIGREHRTLGVNALEVRVHGNRSNFDAQLLEWRNLESAALDAERDLDRLGQGRYEPHLCELSLLAQQLRACADTALHALLDSTDTPRQ
ncbi:hypothetical protein ACPWT1_20290 [Ramlibacter sp. MMS24-I3-19]|uniref:hypothetical protein n=1 Tax=Ramlibacter sp. MMS24-I3-19 TaxID=3416606 RepID=UPI003D08063D